MAISPMQLSLRWLRKSGFLAEPVERWAMGHRHDLFGFVDIVAVDPKSSFSKPSVMFVQTTTASNIQARFKKMQELDTVIPCISAGVAIQIHGWGKYGPKGKRKLWKPRILCAYRLDNGSLGAHELLDDELQEV